MHNQLHKVNFDYSSTEMSPSQIKYWAHFFKGDPIIGDYIENQSKKNVLLSRELMDQPVCKSCEKFCFFDKDGHSVCPTCGDRFKETESHSFITHIKEGYYR